MVERQAQVATVTLLEKLEQHGILRITELIDADRLEDAHKVAVILQKVGVI